MESAGLGGVAQNLPCLPACLGVCPGLRWGWGTHSPCAAPMRPSQLIQPPCPRQPRGHLQASPSQTRVLPSGHCPPPHPLITYHVNELRDRQAKVDKNYIRDVGHGPGPLVVAREEFLQQPLLRVGPGLHVAAHCGDQQVCGSGAGDGGRPGCPLGPPARPCSAPGLSSSFSQHVPPTSGPLHVLPYFQPQFLPYPLGL